VPYSSFAEVGGLRALKQRESDKGPKKKQPSEGSRKQTQTAPQLPEKANEAPRRVPPLRPPTPEDDRGDSRE